MMPLHAADSAHLTVALLLSLPTLQQFMVQIRQCLQSTVETTCKCMHFKSSYSILLMFQSEVKRCMWAKTMSTAVAGPDDQACRTQSEKSSRPSSVSELSAAGPNLPPDSSRSSSGRRYSENRSCASNSAEPCTRLQSASKAGHATLQQQVDTS